MQGVLGSSLSDVIFFFHFFRFSLIPSQSACLYIIASFEVHLIAENNYPHVLVVLFLKSSTVQYILTPSIFDMTLLYSTNSLKSMTDMPGSSNFRLRGGWGGKTRIWQKKALSTFWSSNLSTGGSTSSTFLQWDQQSISKKTVLFGSKGGPTFSRGGGWTHLLIPYRTCDFSRWVWPTCYPPPPHPPTPPTPPTPQPHLLVRAWLISHKMIVFHVLIMNYV